MPSVEIVGSFPDPMTKMDCTARVRAALMFLIMCPCKIRHYFAYASGAVIWLLSGGNRRSNGNPTIHQLRIFTFCVLIHYANHTKSDGRPRFLCRAVCGHGYSNGGRPILALCIGIAPASSWHGCRLMMTRLRVQAWFRWLTHLPVWMTKCAFHLVLWCALLYMRSCKAVEHWEESCALNTVER